MPEVTEYSLTILQNRIKDLEEQIAKKNKDHGNYRWKFKELQEKYARLESENRELNESIKEWDSYKDDVDKVLNENEELSKFRDESLPILDEVGKLHDLVDQLTEEVKTLRDENSLLKQKAALPPDEANQRAIDAERRLTRIRNESVFQDALKELKDPSGRPLTLNRGVTLDKVFQESGVSPDSEEIDAARAKDTLSHAVNQSAYLFAPAETAEHVPGGTRPTAIEPRPPGPGAARGAPSTQGGYFTITPEQARSSKFMIENNEAIYQAQKAGRFRIV